MASVSISNVVKSYGSLTVVHGVDLDIDDGEFVVLLGPSGCGKTTTLRMVAGLEDISGGAISIGGQIVSDKPPKDRKIAMVFQNYALYPHMTVRQNMEFALRPQKLPKPEAEAKIAKISGMLGLDPLLARLPAQLSGGQRQRVAMGRAMVRTPEVFLFDEPLSNLDAKLRTQVRMEIAKLHKQLGTTVIYVTHDQVEAMTLADKIVIMRDGRIEQIGKPEEVFLRPRNLFVATFIGTPSMNLFKMTAKVAPGGSAVVCQDFSVPLPARFEGLVREGQAVTLGVRPSDIRLVAAGEQPLINAKVEVVEYLGVEALIDLRCGPQEFIAQIPAGMRPAVDSSIGLTFENPGLHLFDTETGNSLNANKEHANG
ncbi:ABC transporter ATP-binding protein [Rhizobium leguminosarum]|uniref:ABC transporter ATP-binding protein n=1 Tax=Rhizobium leguminosarum TaxID=384 RepID=UPI001C977842|nr:sn-glycerol-3-phosphate ABC transporter ATP-binding protein UgpC [Rhizobium leguminosarum]MBY5404652.1 sn-glycerol-3-phosphate ABC transporter ATP-binding protein UgpC [Rhizobium leguminosarum]